MLSINLFDFDEIDQKIINEVDHILVGQQKRKINVTSNDGILVVLVVYVVFYLIQEGLLNIVVLVVEDQLDNRVGTSVQDVR